MCAVPLFPWADILVKAHLFSACDDDDDDGFSFTPASSSTSFPLSCTSSLIIRTTPHEMIPDYIITLRMLYTRWKDGGGGNYNACHLKRKKNLPFILNSILYILVLPRFFLFSFLSLSVWLFVSGMQHCNHMAMIILNSLNPTTSLW